MKFLSVCSGIEAASVAWGPLGWQAVAFSEIEPFPCSLLAHHYQNTPNWGDMTKFQEWPDVSIDILCGGTPCQSFSVAGLRKGLDDPRGNLMLTFGAIAAKYRPKWLVWENVPGVLSSNNGRDFGAFLGMLGQLGYGFAYRVLDAQYFGVAQRRRRVFVVGCLGDWHSAAAVLFERHSLQGHPAPSREAGKKPTGTLSARTKGGGGLGTDFELGGGLVPEVAGTMKSCKDSGGWSNSVDHAAAGYMVPCATGVTIHGTDKTAKVASYTDIAGALRARTPGSQENSSTTVLMVPYPHADISPALKARDSKGSSSDGDGDGAVFEEGSLTAPLTTQTDPCANVICFAQNQRDEVRIMDVVGAKQQSYLAYGIRTANTSSNGWGIQEEATHTLDQAMGIAVAFPINTQIAMRHNQLGESTGFGIGGESDPAFTLTKGHSHAVAYDDPRRFNDPHGGFEHGDIYPTLDAASGLNSTCAQGGTAVATPPAMQVRRLTPTECERLQGFQDGYTNVPHRGKPAADGNRYKALGNSWAVPVVNWIGRRIQAHIGGV